MTALSLIGGNIYLTTFFALLTLWATYVGYKEDISE